MGKRFEMLGGCQIHRLCASPDLAALACSCAYWADIELGKIFVAVWKRMGEAGGAVRLVTHELFRRMINRGHNLNSGSDIYGRSCRRLATRTRC